MPKYIIAEFDKHYHTWTRHDEVLEFKSKKEADEYAENKGIDRHGYEYHSFKVK